MFPEEASKGGKQAKLYFHVKSQPQPETQKEFRSTTCTSEFVLHGDKGAVFRFLTLVFHRQPGSGWGGNRNHRPLQLMVC